MNPRWAHRAVVVAALVALAVPGRAGECDPFQSNGNPDVQNVAPACLKAAESVERLVDAQDKLRTAAAAAEKSPDSPDAIKALETARNDYNAASRESDMRIKAFVTAAGILNFPMTKPFADAADRAAFNFNYHRDETNALASNDGAGTGTKVLPAMDGPKTLDTSKRAIGDGPTRVETTVRAAAQSIGSGDPAGAEKLLTQALAKDPGDPAALGLRAQARMSQGNREGALEDAREALKGNPDDKASRALVSELESLERASGKIKGNKLDFGAERAPEGDMSGGRPGAKADGAGAASPSSASAAAARPAPDAGAASSAAPAVRSLIQRAQQLNGIGDFTGAMLPLREALDLDPRRPELWDMLAEISNKTGNFKGALAAAENALKLDPGDARALRAKSYAEFSLGDYRLALQDAEQAVRLDPGNGLGYLYRAMAEEKLGDKEQALADYQKAEALDPTLAGLADAGLKRLGGGAAAATSPGLLSRRTLVRGGAIAASTLLIVLGLMGTAAGRRLTTRGRRAPAPPLDDSDETVAIGARLAGNYRVTRELGRGGMGVVYQAYDETLQRDVAIKQLQREGRSNPEDLERFLKEARLVAQLKHPHMAQIFSVINEGGGLLLVFEYVDGRTLDQALAAEKRLPPEKARRLIGEICGALEYAHGRKIIHRDLKPSNVMIDASGCAKIMDFGIAHQSRSDASQTKTGASGTPPYMAPEQAFGSVSKSADLYALAVMTYEMLTGVRPFPGPDFLGPKLRGEFPAAAGLNPALPGSVDGFFKRALDPDPAKRHADADEFARALDEALGAAPERV